MGGVPLPILLSTSGCYLVSSNLCQERGEEPFVLTPQRWEVAQSSHSSAATWTGGHGGRGWTLQRCQAVGVLLRSLLQRLWPLAAPLLCPSCPLEPPNLAVFSFPALPCPPRAPLQSPRAPKHWWGALSGCPISHRPEELDAAGRRGLHGCPGEGICSLEREDVLQKDEAKHNDTTWIGQSLEVFGPFYSSSSPKQISRINLRIWVKFYLIIGISLAWYWIPGDMILKDLIHCKWYFLCLFSYAFSLSLKSTSWPFLRFLRRVPRDSWSGV